MKARHLHLLLIGLTAAAARPQGYLGLRNGDLLSGSLLEFREDSFRFQPRWSENAAELSADSFHFYKNMDAVPEKSRPLPAWRLELHGGHVLYVSDLRWEKDGFRFTRGDGVERSLPPGVVQAVLPVHSSSRMVWSEVPPRAQWRMNSPAGGSLRESREGVVLQGQGPWGLSSPDWPSRFHLSMHLQTLPQQFFVNFSILGATFNITDNDALQFQIYQNRITATARAPFPNHPSVFGHQQVWSEQTAGDGTQTRSTLDIFGDMNGGRFLFYLNGVLVKQWHQKNQKASAEAPVRWLCLHHGQQGALQVSRLQLQSWDGFPPRAAPLPRHDTLTRAQTVGGELVEGELIAFEEGLLVLRTPAGAPREISAASLLRMVPPQAHPPPDTEAPLRISFGGLGESLPLRDIHLDQTHLTGRLYQDDAPVRLPFREIRLMEKVSPHVPGSPD